MELSDGEKLILTMLCELSAHLKIQGKVDPKLVSAALTSGNTWGIRHEYPGIFETKTANEAITDEVRNFLDMWAYIENAYRELTPTQKEIVEREAAPVGSNVRFSGFDPNYEVDHWATANFLVNHTGRFNSFRGRNPHAQHRHASPHVCDLSQAGDEWLTDRAGECDLSDCDIAGGAGGGWGVDWCHEAGKLFKSKGKGAGSPRSRG